LPRGVEPGRDGLVVDLQDPCISGIRQPRNQYSSDPSTGQDR
jgi:hypothetical protein